MTAHRAALIQRRATIAEIGADSAFRSGLPSPAVDGDGQGDASVEAAQAARVLEEMVAAHNDAVPEFSDLLSRIFDRRSFRGVLDYDVSALAQFKELDGKQSLVVTTAHRSYLDFLIRVPFAQHHFEREYRFAGANILFWPMGPIGHNLGIIFIRRGARDPLYTYVLRQYVGWLTAHRANFMWAIEGGRTRTGKLLRPKVGLLAYVADAYVSGRTTGVTFVPTTIVYEYLNEVFEYADYGRGATKTGEGLGQLLRYVVRQRRAPADAKIYVGIGQPVNLGDYVQANAGRDQPGYEDGVLRAALAVCRQIDAATPITGVAAVLLPLLAGDRVEMTVEQLVDALQPVYRYADRRGLPTPGDGARGPEGVRHALGLLGRQGLVDRTDVAGEASYTVVPGRHIEAAYYRNSIVHHFLVPAVIEVALGLCANSVAGADCASAFVHQCERIRMLLADEFFFPEGDAYREIVTDVLTEQVPDWQRILAQPGGLQHVRDELPGTFAGLTLTPFLEAYWIVAEGLRRLGPAQVSDEQRFLSGCFGRTATHQAADGLRCPDAASLNMALNPMSYARRHELLADGVPEERAAFASEVRSCLDAVRTADRRSAQPRARSAE